MKKGFTFIELIITITIVGILALIAYPTYIDYMTRARRIEGQSALLDLANHLENYYAEHQTYQTATINTLRDANTLENQYTLRILDASENTYTLQATPIDIQAKADTRCQSLTFNSLGQKGVAVGPMGSPTGTAQQCW